MTEFYEVDYMLNKFITVMVAPDNYDQISFYKDIRNCFAYLHGKNITNPLLYWNNSKREYAKLVDFSIDMLIIPA